MLKRYKLFAILFSLGLGGCAHFPVSSARLESPETFGERKKPLEEGEASPIGRIEFVNLSGGTSLLYNYDDTLSQYSTYLGFSLGIMVRILDNLDAGLRLQFAAPPMLRVKYQFLGDSRAHLKAGSYAISLLGEGGVAIGSFTVPSFNGTFSALRLSAIGGYRLLDRISLYGGPFLDFYAVSGSFDDQSSTKNTAAVITIAQNASIESSQFGGFVGFMMEWEALLLKIEVILNNATANQLSQFSFYGATQFGAHF